MPELNPYEAPQVSEMPSASSGVFKQLLLGGAFVLQFVLMGLFYWLDLPGQHYGFSPFAVMGLGSLALVTIICIFITAVVRRSWQLMMVQVFVFMSYLFMVMFIM